MGTLDLTINYHIPLHPQCSHSVKLKALHAELRHYEKMRKLQFEAGNYIHGMHLDKIHSNLKVVHKKLRKAGVRECLN